jgi:hypothetical protein
MSDAEDEDMGELPPPRDGPLLTYGTLSSAVGRSAAGVAAAVESGNVQLAEQAEHLELSLVRAQATPRADAACAQRPPPLPACANPIVSPRRCRIVARPTARAAGVRRDA